MTLKKVLFSLLSFLPPLFLSPAVLHAQSSTGSAVLTSVSGKVTVVRAKKTVTLHQDSKVHEGETLTTASGANATVRLFDGPELQVKPGTKFVLSRIQKRGTADKVLRFKLLLGRLFASVQKLASSKSSFEVEAGGVVCGVRGTQYEVDYDPGKNKVDLFVKEGNVWAQAGGSTYQYGAGSEGHFTGGKLIPPNGGNGKGNKDQGKKGKGNEPPGPPSNLDPFYGMGGNRPDPFQPLTGVGTDTGTITNKTDDANLQGLGAHTLIIQLKYPEL